MVFHSLSFLIFFPVVVLVYYFLPPKRRHLWLLAASYFYYMCWNIRYALLMLLSTFITYISGIWMERIRRRNWNRRKKTLRKKWVVFLSFFLNLSILFFFKYYNFAADLLNGAFTALQNTIRLPSLDLLLPVGISFYTFQALSYTVDVYREDIYAEQNFFRYALFVSFFPQLVAGPIERSKDLLVQLATPKRFDYEQAREGLLLMIWGFFIKLVIADRIAVFVDAVYADTSTYTGWYLILATFLFNYQVYCDFAGYSTIALGAAKIMGFQLTENFNAPYLSRSMGEFWRRWHVSLGTWFRDYVYFPLGGSRKGKLKKYRNLMVVFLLCGLWHGASLTYVVWGGLNGLYQVLGDLLKPVRDFIVKLLHIHRDTVGHQVFQVIVTMILISSFVPFFRASSLEEAWEIYRSMFTVGNIWILFDGSLYTLGLDEPNFRLMLLSIAVLIFADLCRYHKISISKTILAQDAWIRGLCFGLAASAVLLFGMWGPMVDSSAFIYYQF